MTKSVVSKVESPEAETPRLSIPVLVWIPTGCARTFYYILCLLRNPTLNTGRRINVDRVSIRKDAAWKKAIGRWCKTINSTQTRTVSRRRLRERPESGGSVLPSFTNADSYSRCFSQFDRKTDCFDGQVAERLCAVSESLGICGAESSTQVRILPCPPKQFVELKPDRYRRDYVPCR